MSFGLTVVNCKLSVYGAGKHIEALEVADIRQSLKLAFATRLLYQVTLGTTKIGICMFNIRVFKDRVSKIWMYLSIGSVASFTVALLVAVIFQCTPVKSWWEVTPQPSGKCVSNLPGVIVSAACNIVTDALLLGFAIWRISKL
jgi:hypothetical protein